MSEAAVVVAFVLYSRSWCHLCEDMLAALKAMEAPPYRFEIDVIDVDLDPALVARFDELVPVLFARGAEASLCHYFLDHEAVGRHLARLMPAGPGGTPEKPAFLP